jgi:hypothetical protein
MRRPYFSSAGSASSAKAGIASCRHIQDYSASYRHECAFGHFERSRPKAQSRGGRHPQTQRLELTIKRDVGDLAHLAAVLREDRRPVVLTDGVALDLLLIRHLLQRKGPVQHVEPRHREAETRESFK